ncbi:Hypothetical predicted protein [Lecanosticta acicola]|uniref:Uncharacterized protein n=1 Tax=Lecanosticta acicola TaxID=111012 RepID=A0AAI8YXB6_9PEZI|nr:Hypothetical predicted protein [Lecanosticta acicola]
MWPVFDPTASPHPLSLQVRRPWRNHALVSVEERALEALLPEYARQASRRPYDADSLIDQFVLDSPELWPMTKTNPLVEEELRNVFYSILQAMTRSCHGEVDRLVATHLMERLDNSLASDVGKARHIAEPFCHTEAQHLFRALAEASNRTGSRRIGELLASFFLTRAATYITSTESSLYLGQWLFAIVRANMSEQHRHECFRLAMRKRPDLAIKLAGRGWKANKVIEHLDRAGVHTGTRGGDLLALNLLPGLSIRNGRTCLRDSGLRSPLDGLGKLDGGDDGFWLERLVLAQEDAAKQGRRMLQLTMGRRYADRFDPPDALNLMGGLGGLSFGRDGRLHCAEESEI